MKKQEILKSLPEKLPGWYRENARDLPWRRTHDPYAVWVSEIMLQQTRVETVLTYWERFVKELPDIPSLASCPDDVLHKYWEGLGYYRRADNMKKAACVIMEKHGGAFPSSYKDILSLPGIGSYTAGAVSSMKSTESPNISLVPLCTVCLPNGLPRCGLCPMRELCLSKKAGSYPDFPVRSEKKAKKQEHLTVFLFDHDGRNAIRQRTEKGLLQGLWEFPNVPGTLTEQEAVREAERMGVSVAAVERQMNRTHLFTHVVWQMRCYVIRCANEIPGCVWCSRSELDETYAVPSAFRKLLD